MTWCKYDSSDCSNLRPCIACCPGPLQPEVPIVRRGSLSAELESATTKLLEVAELMADGCTVGNFGTLQNRLRARAKAVRSLRAKLGMG